MKLYVTDHDGNEQQIEGIDGWQLMEAIRDEGMEIKAECGGACACATCHVYIDEEWKNKIPEKSEEEMDMLDLAFDVQENSLKLFDFSGFPNRRKKLKCGSNTRD